MPLRSTRSSICLSLQKALVELKRIVIARLFCKTADRSDAFSLPER